MIIIKNTAHKILSVLIYFILLCLPLSSFSASELKDVTLSSKGPSQTQIEFLLDSSTHHHLFTLSNPFRVVLDLVDSKLAKKILVPPLAETPIRTIRMAPKKEGGVRIVFDMQAPVDAQITSSTPNFKSGSKDFRLGLLLTQSQNNKTSLDKTPDKTKTITEAAPEDTKSSETKPSDKSDAKALQSSGSGTLQAVQDDPQNAPPSASSGPDPLEAEISRLTQPHLPKLRSSLRSQVEDTDPENSNSESAGKVGNATTPTSPDFPPAPLWQGEIKKTAKLKRQMVVVIDPGHGGKDPGAIGPNGGREKDVVLAISQKLQRELNRIPGIRAVLTRTGDYYIGLRERLHIARHHKADFFIAIHADAYKDPYASGASVFALSERGATSEAARWLAEKENYSELGGVNLHDKSYLLRSVLLDLSQTATISQSLEIGRSVLHYLGKLTRLHRGRVEQARFVVLKSPDIPSLLVETGFLSNPSEEARLRSREYQQRLVEALTLGIRNYFLRHPLYSSA